jgi:hypothetical protein
VVRSHGALSADDRSFDARVGQRGLKSRPDELQRATAHEKNPGRASGREVIVLCRFFFYQKWKLMPARTNPNR